MSISWPRKHCYLCGRVIVFAPEERVPAMASCPQGGQCDWGLTSLINALDHQHGEEMNDWAADYQNEPLKPPVPSFLSGRASRALRRAKSTLLAIRDFTENRHDGTESWTTEILAILDGRQQVTTDSDIQF